MKNTATIDLKEYLQMKEFIDKTESGMYCVHYNEWNHIGFLRNEEGIDILNKRIEKLVQERKDLKQEKIELSEALSFLKEMSCRQFKMWKKR